jgi:hypothetical protein
VGHAATMTAPTTRSWEAAAATWMMAMAMVSRSKGEGAATTESLGCHCWAEMLLLG